MYKKLIGIVAILAIILLFLFGAYKLGQLIFGSPNAIRLDQTSVIKEMRELSRLETASFTIEKIIEGGNQNGKTGGLGNFFQNVLYGDRILLIAHADITAGFDLKKLSDKDVLVERNTLTINLPPPEILLVRIDNEKTKVYDRKEGLLSKGGKDLESRARLEAEKAIRQDACKADILEVASENARKQLKALFTTAGFKEVKVYIPQTMCE